MNKNTNKRKRHNHLAVNITAEKFGYTARYVRGCLNDDFKGIMPDEVKKAYKEACDKINTTITDLKNSKL